MWQFLFLLPFLTSCGYHFGEGGISSQYQTISVPLASGDLEGDLTKDVVEELVKSGVYTYVRDGGAVTLNIDIVDEFDENIGFRYDRKNDGKRRHEIIPTETRAFIVAEVSLSETYSCKTLLGPARITAWIDFDHDYYTTRGEVNVFSLGQLNDYDEAYDAVYIPLNRLLAQKIVDFVQDSW